MDTTVIVTLVVFAALALLVVVLSLRQSGQRKAGMEQFAANHGWQFLGTDSSQVESMLTQIDPKENWRAWNIILVEGPPQSVYLFSYRTRTTPRGSGGEYGFACLADRAGWRWMNEDPVAIYRRVPLVEKLLGDRVEVGGPEFRQEFTVACRRPDVAATMVNEAVQSILLQHVRDPQWLLHVRITQGRLLVTTSWAQKPEEWDYLIGLTRRLRTALP